MGRFAQPCGSVMSQAVEGWASCPSGRAGTPALHKIEVSRDGLARHLCSASEFLLRTEKNKVGVVV